MQPITIASGTPKKNREVEPAQSAQIKKKRYRKDKWLDTFQLSTVNEQLT